MQNDLEEQNHDMVWWTGTFMQKSSPPSEYRFSAKIQTSKQT